MDKKKILIVEDEDHMRRMLSLELETAGYEVYEAPDGRQGFHLARHVRPDLIISDILMPQMDGNQLMKELRASDFGKEIPFLVLTARGQMHDYFETMEVDDFIIKPFDAEDLLTRVKRVLHQRALKAPPEKNADISLGAKRKIFILDEDVFTGSKLEQILTHSGYEVSTVNTAAECIERALRLKPEAVLLNYSVGGMRADQMISLMKGMSGFHQTAFLVYSRERLGEEQKKALTQAAPFFLEALDSETVVGSVRRALEKS